MKKTLLVAIALFAALSVNAQNEVEKKNEISISYGMGTRAGVEYTAGSILTGMTRQNHKKDEKREKKNS
jgi:hypothetical protein